MTILATKLYIPPVRPKIVLRPRLIERLNKGLSSGCKLTLISASAGFGKTTMVSEWVAGCGRPAAWLSLDEGDNDITHFLTYIVAALQTIAANVGAAVLDVLQSPQPPPTKSILTALLNEMSTVSDNFILVLDDYHVIDAKPVDNALTFLLEHLPPQMHLVIATREEPGLPLARLRARDQLTELRAADLRFTPAEAAEFLNQIMGLNLTAEDIAALEARTEGWIAGLQLAAISMQGHQDTTSFIQSFTGSHHFVMDYLVEEVLQQQSEGVQTFLLRTSILDRICSALCNAVLLDSSASGQEILEYVEHANLFLIPLDDAREWFRYHHLFAEFLRKRLLAEYSEDVVRELHQRASHWFAEHADILSAIEHALAAKDYEYAACLIAPQSQQWMQRGEISTIIKYLNQLPRHQVWNDWSLCLWYGWSYAVRGDLNPAGRWTNRLEALITPLIQETTLKESGPVSSDLQNAYVQVLAIRSVIARQNKDFASAIALGEQALRLVPEENLNLQIIISALLSSAVLEAGRFDQAEDLLHSTRKRSYRTGNPFITFTLLLNESALAVMRGQLQRAHDLNEETLRLAQAEGMERLAFLPQLRLGRINYFWNQLPQARQYVTPAIEQADMNAYPSPTVRGYITLAWIQNAEGQYPQALQTLADAEQIALSQHELESVEMVRGVRAQLQFSVGEHEAVTRWIKSSDWESLDSSKSGLVLSDESFFPYCQILIASGESLAWKRVERLLEWRLMDSGRQRRHSAILKIRLMQAFLHHTKNQPNFAIASLLQALEIAMPENCIRPFLDEGQPLIPYLRRVPPRHAARGFTQKILAYISTPHIHSQLLEQLSRQELNILQLIAQGHTNPEIAVKLVLAVSTVRWYAKQIFRKLGVHNRTQAAAQAKKLNLI